MREKKLTQAFCVVLFLLSLFTCGLLSPPSHSYSVDPAVGDWASFVATRSAIEAPH